MLIRTCLLAAFGLVVPLIAMFSHLVPSGAGDALWEAVWQPASAFFSEEAASDVTAATESTPPPATADEDPRTELASPSAAVSAASPVTATSSTAFAAADLATNTGQPAGVVLPTVEIDTNRVASAGPATTSVARQQSTEAEPAPLAAAVTEEATSPLWSRSSPVADAAVQPVTLATAEPAAAAAPATISLDPALTSALTQLGAFDIACQPTIGGRYHHCSCRVAADPSGQLVRMFHATDATPEQAIHRLLADVYQWKSAQNSAPTPGPASVLTKPQNTPLP